MLILTRQLSDDGKLGPHRQIVLQVPPSDEASTITVYLIEVAGKKVRLGFEAPPQVGIRRGEHLLTSTDTCDRHNDSH